MKHIFMYAMAAMALMSVTSCNEREMDLTPAQAKSESEGMGYIRINATTDDAVTRATITGPGSSYTWYATVQDKDSKYKWPSEGSAFTAITDALNSVAIPAGNCTVKVRNFPDLTTALDQTPLSGSSDNTKYGAPYWEGEKTEVVKAGAEATEIKVACGTPQNAKLTVAQSNFIGDNMASNVTIHLTNATNSRDINFTYSGSAFNNGGVAYFAAKEAVRFYITYNYGDDSSNLLRYPAENANPNYGTITMGDPGTSNLLTIKSNGNGTISLTIDTTDFTAATTETTTLITFNALNGSIVNN